MRSQFQVSRTDPYYKFLFSDKDRSRYLKILKEQCLRFGVSIWSYCLMDNHVHFIAVPDVQESLALCFGQTHRHYTRMINFREGWRGYLWQGRFSSYMLDENYLYAAVRYVENNPVDAGLVSKAEDYPWSSAPARVYKQKDDLLSDYFLTKDIANWSEFLRSKYEEDPADALLDVHANTGRPLAEPGFIQWLEEHTGAKLTKGKPGPKAKEKAMN